MSEHRDYDLICIGSGPAGQRAAVQAAKLGKRVAIVERQRIVGGVCLTMGTIPSKTLREAVMALVSARNRAKSHFLSFDPYGTWQEIGERISGVIATERRVIEHQLARNDIDLISGTASFEDPHTLMVDDGRQVRRLTTEHVLVAVGTTATPPPDVPIDGRHVVTSDQILQMERLPRTLCVVGAGVIGLEYASILAQLDMSVTVVDKRMRPLEFLDHEIVDELIHQMRGTGVSFRVGDSVASLEVQDGHAPRVRQAHPRRRGALLRRADRRDRRARSREGRPRRRRPGQDHRGRALPHRGPLDLRRR